MQCHNALYGKGTRVPGKSSRSCRAGRVLAEDVAADSTIRLLAAAPVRYHHPVDDTGDKNRNAAPAGWLEALARSEADVAAGRTVPGEAVMERLRKTIAEMEAAEAESGKAALQR